MQEGVCTYSFRSVHLSVSWAIAPDKALPMCSIAASSTGPFPGPSRPGSKQQRQNSGLVISLPLAECATGGDPVWSLGDGLQGILSSTGQVQCGQVHCRLPYTAPPVHLKADMDGPLSNRGEKVNGAWLCLVGQSFPAGNGFLAAFPTTEWQITRAPSVAPRQSSEQLLVCLLCPTSLKPSLQPCPPCPLAVRPYLLPL